MTTLSSRVFNQNTGAAKHAAEKGPVLITDRGCPSHVLRSIQDYRRLTRREASIVEFLAMPDADAVTFDPPRLEGEPFRSADLS